MTDILDLPVGETLRGVDVLVEVRQNPRNLCFRFVKYGAGHAPLP